MDEIFKKLLEANVLNESTKRELEGSLTAHLAEITQEHRAIVEAEVRAEMATKWVNDRDALISAIDAKLDEGLVAELAELREDIDNFRNLEAEYAIRLVENKKELALTLDNELDELTEKMDGYFSVVLERELNELREDIQAIRRDDFGRAIFEAFRSEYEQEFVTNNNSREHDVRKKDAMYEQRTEKIEAHNAVLLERLATMQRDLKMTELLTPLSGNAREVMEVLLSRLPLDRLEEGFNTFIGKVLSETHGGGQSEKENNNVLAENSSNMSVKETMRVSGDDVDRVTLQESEQRNRSNNSLVRLAFD